MKKTLILFVFLLVIVSVSSGFAQTVVPVEQNVYYMCGDTFEICFPDVIATGNMFTNAGSVQATTNMGEALLQVRVYLRNMTTSVFHGIAEDSFKLTGYVRDRSLTYTPEIILNTDYFGAGNYFSWDQLPPLRAGDILLVFRVNPILINWELSFDPVFLSEPDYQLETVVYPRGSEESCSAVFQFPVVRDLITGELTTFNRKSVVGNRGLDVSGRMSDISLQWPDNGGQWSEAGGR